VNNVVDIQAHPRYAPHFEVADDVEELDEDEILKWIQDEGILGQTAQIYAPGDMTSPAAEGAIGNSFCWLCVHRKDTRSGLTMLLRRPRVTDYECRAAGNLEVQDPVTGEVGYEREVVTPLGLQRDVGSPKYQLCKEMNPRGHCTSIKLHS
jgi:hypothetical protein